MESDEFCWQTDKSQFIGEAQGIMRGLICGDSLTKHESKVCQAWVDKVETRFAKRLKEKR